MAKTIAEDFENYQLDSTICGNLFDKFDSEEIEGNEEISPLDKENITPIVSGNIVMETSHIGLNSKAYHFPRVDGFHFPSEFRSWPLSRK